MITNKNLLNVYIVTYNRAQYLHESISSVLGQTYKNFDLFVVDNASTDHTKQVVDSFHDDRLHYIRHPQNIGGGGNIQYAMDHNQKKYFVIFHDDDLMHEEFLEQELAIMENNSEICLLSCIVDTIDECGRIITYGKKSDIIQKFCGDELFRNYLKKRQYIVFPSIMYRSDFIKNNNIRLCEDVGPSADIKLCFDVERYGGMVAVLQNSLMSYRIHSTQDSVVNRVSMICQLFNYLRNDEYYSKLLMQYENGVKGYYKRMLYNEICILLKGNTNADATIDSMNMYRETLASCWGAEFVFKLICNLYKLFPHTLHALYTILFRMKQKLQ